MNKAIDIKVGDIFRTKDGSSFQFLRSAVIVITGIKQTVVYYDYLVPNEKKYYKGLGHFNTNELTPVSPVEKELFEV